MTWRRTGWHLNKQVHLSPLNHISASESLYKQRASTRTQTSESSWESVDGTRSEKGLLEASASPKRGITIISHPGRGARSRMWGCGRHPTFLLKSHLSHCLLSPEEDPGSPQHPSRRRLCSYAVVCCGALPPFPRPTGIRKWHTPRPPDSISTSVPSHGVNIVPHN